MKLEEAHAAARAPIPICHRGRPGQMAEQAEGLALERLARLATPQEPGRYARCSGGAAASSRSCAGGNFHRLPACPVETNDQSALPLDKGAGAPASLGYFMNLPPLAQPGGNWIRRACRVVAMCLRAPLASGGPNRASGGPQLICVSASPPGPSVCLAAGWRAQNMTVFGRGRRKSGINKQIGCQRRPRSRAGALIGRAGCRLAAVSSRAHGPNRPLSGPLAQVRCDRSI